MPLDQRSLPAAHATATLYADVIVPRHIAKAFTYVVPPALAQSRSAHQCSKER